MRPAPAKAESWERVLEHLKRAVLIAPLLAATPGADASHIEAIVAKHVNAAQALLKATP